MARKRKEQTVRATKITPIVRDENFVKKAEPTIDTVKENKFQQLCLTVSEVLRGEKGRKLSCRVRVLVEDSSAVIYQGMLSNVWGRLTYDGKHAIYRHALKQVLLEDERTKHICD
tara:strand:- start:1530 stop:1874 length:345 start_codon:yes stop_codon:yes gene_type:complete